MRRVSFHLSFSLLFFFLISFLFTLLPLFLHSTPRAPLLVINLAGSIPEGYLVLIYELRVVRPAGREYLLFFSSLLLSRFFFLFYENASGTAAIQFRLSIKFRKM